jgi:hypothetical protein
MTAQEKEWGRIREDREEGILKKLWDSGWLHKNGDRVRDTYKTEGRGITEETL